MTPKRLFSPICAVCFTRGIIRIANGTNIPLTMYKYTRLYPLLCALFLPMAYPIMEWITILRATVTNVMKRLLPREFQKSVTRIASRKFSRLQELGSDKIPEILLVISDGCLNAMTTVRYNGNAMVISPNTKKIMAGLFVFVFAPIITAPPFSLILSSASLKLQRSQGRK